MHFHSAPSLQERSGRVAPPPGEGSFNVAEEKSSRENFDVDDDDDDDDDAACECI